MKNSIYIIIILLIIISCSTSNKTINDKNIAQSTSDTVRIANDSLEYEVIIIDAGFNSWLYTNAKPRGYYSESFLENRNQFMVAEWNRRAMNPTIYNANLYEMPINYENSIHYGYEVNYLIYNYFMYFQIKNNQRLGIVASRP